MARRARAGPLDVYLNGRLVGRLRREASGAIDFVYDESWLAWSNTMPISLSLPLREERYVGAPVAAVFDNLLPDNEAIRARVAAKVGAEGVDAFSLLAALGRDCVGALQFQAEGQAPPQVELPQGEIVSNHQIEEILSNLARSPLGIERDADFRISIAGAQEKTAFLRSGEAWRRPFGATPTTHIFKPQIGRLPNGLDLSNSVENEYLCLTLLRALGLATANVEMASFGDRRVLVVERFDRRWLADGRLLRVPQEDFCQALSTPWTLKYESDGGPGVVRCMSLLAVSDEPNLDRQAFMKTIMSFWLLAATDGHAKNFSLFLHPGGRARMTPLYDVLSAQPSLAAGQVRHNQMKLAMAVGDKRRYRVDEVAPRHFVQTGLAAGLSEVTTLELLAGLVEEGPTALANALGALPKDFPDAVSAPIAEGFLQRIEKIERAIKA
ncbi:type II toxin-antitoxin system HipA family toxin [Phenylobacterium sp. LjRoot164]|uniref:type II toxin-antitoxin system HipA family toxin n=1 Tax=unclassified Phenylobacterium TaxID=2640670 RepID=UPI003ECE39DE